MTLVEAVRSCFRNYIRFSGRAPRSEFWKFFLFVVVFNVAAIAINSLLFGPELIRQTFTIFGSDGIGSTGIRTKLLYSGGWIGDLFTLACLVPMVAVGWRRLHDSGAAGWWLLLPFAVLVAPLIFALFATIGLSEFWVALKATGNVRVHISGSMGVVVLLMIIASSVFLILRLCRRSDPNANRYGPNPLEATP